VSGVPPHWRSPDTLDSFPPLTATADQDANGAAEQSPGGRGVK